MRKMIMVLICLMGVISPVLASADFYIDEVSPLIVYPGDAATLNLTLMNLANDYALFLRAELDSSDVTPITAVGSQKKTVDRVEAALKTDYFGIVTQKVPVRLSYDIKVDDNATQGTYNVPLLLTWRTESGQTNTQTLYIGMDVVGEPDLVISKRTLSPERVYPDSDFTLSLELENIGTDKAQAVECDLQLPEVFSGENMAFLGTVNKETKATASYALKASREARNQPYSVKAIITYKDDDGERHVEKEFQVFVSRRGDIDLEIAGVSTSPAKIYPGTDFTLSVQLENIGTQDAKSVMATVSNSGGFVGEFSSFIGKIEADDVSSGIFDLTAIPTVTPGDHTFNMEVLYTDEKGDEYKETKTFNVYVDNEPEKSPLGIIIALLAVVVVVVVIWRRRRAARILEE